MLLSDRLQQHRQQYGTKIVYSTGRSPVLYREIQQEKKLFFPDAVVVGWVEVTKSNILIICLICAVI
ncbi:hypothetical protein H6G25_15940 [Dolichospermum sp. FACHB-1091]|nr:hypothetical protein [Dolichospermum sp. FACHB-1091]